MYDIWQMFVSAYLSSQDIFMHTYRQKLCIDIITCLKKTMEIFHS